MTGSMLLIVLVVLLAVPVFLLLAPRFSGGLVTTAYEREARMFLSGSPEVSFDSSFEVNAKKRRAIIGTLSGATQKRSTSARLTIAKKLKYAQWPISAILFHAIEIFVASVLYIVSSKFHLGDAIEIMSFFLGFILLRSLLGIAMKKRFKRFDADYPQFMMSVVGLLKTGMAPINAIQSAAQGLDPHSLVRAEVHSMVERMRMGIPEERSIGAFGEAINHPEIELFIQALLLSKRVGGGLSDTLERLAKQVRKRQYFRSAANAAVSLQRASLWMILGILVFLELYIYKVYPALVVEAWHNPSGWFVWQGAIVTIFMAILWSRSVTNIKV